MIWMPLFRIRRDENGSVLTEFAIWASAFFLVAMAALDFGGYYIERSSISEAISAASVQAFQEREETSFSALPAYVRNLAEDQTLSVELSCNGVANSCTNTNRTCSCLKNDGSYVAQSCSTVCTGSGMTSNSLAGYYLTIKASSSYEPVLVPRGILANAPLSQSTTVRLQ